MVELSYYQFSYHINYAILKKNCQKATGLFYFSNLGRFLENLKAFGKHLYGVLFPCPKLKKNQIQNKRITINKHCYSFSTLISIAVLMQVSSTSGSIVFGRNCIHNACFIKLLLYNDKNKFIE